MTKKQESNFVQYICFFKGFKIYLKDLFTKILKTKRFLRININATLVFICYLNMPTFS